MRRSNSKACLRALVGLALCFAAARGADLAGCPAGSAVCPAEARQIGEDSALLQLAAAPRRAADGGVFNYHAFHLGDWPHLDMGDNVCDGKGADGAEFQAPIDIQVKGTAYPRLPPTQHPKFWAKDGGCPEAYFLVKSSTWQVEFTNTKHGLNCTNLVMEWKGEAFSLVQLHFHYTSEDTLDFAAFPMQVHMVHSTANGSLAVVGVLIETGTFFRNSFLEQIFKAGFNASREVAFRQKFNPYAGLLSAGGNFWQYQGSLTTPPCTPGVQFLIAETRVAVAPGHVHDFAQYLSSTIGDSYGRNSRPVQPLNGRTISMGTFGRVSSGPNAPTCVLSPFAHKRAHNA